MLFIKLLLFAICSTKTFSMDTKVITTTTGKIQGVIEPSSIPGRNVQKFPNIPYAEVPVGKLRFSKPVPKKPWNGTLKSSPEPIGCLHHQLPIEKKLNSTEDCLILNIWTPYPQKTNQSVMIWIHGGAYVWGYSGSHVGHNLVAVGDVILVTINYRLSALGFLTSGDQRIKGNFGLFDQRLAMKWVKDNIANFGGDPQSITIFGESSGGTSASAHTLSKKSWPYFDRAIFQSGVMIMPWGSISQPMAKYGFDVFLRNFNCTNNEHLLSCLQSVPISDMERIYQGYPASFDWYNFGPVIDGDFLEDKPEILLSKGHVKNGYVIIGIMKDEEFVMVQDLLQQSRNIIFFETELKKLLTTHFSNYSFAVREQALELYQPKCVQSFLEAFRQNVNFRTDITYLCDAITEANIRSEHLKSNVYFYQYSYSSIVLPPQPYPNFYTYGTFGFAAHLFDVTSVFGFPINNPKYPPDDQILSMRIILYWTNFAKNGDPNIGITKLPMMFNSIDSLPKWPKYTDLTKKYLDMESLSQMNVKTKLREKYCNFLSDPEGFTKKAATTQPMVTIKPTNAAVKHVVQMVMIVVLLLQMFL